MNDRTMHGPRRCDTRWPQTIVMRRAHRQADTPYRRRDTRPSGKHPTDWVLLCILIGLGLVALAGWLR